MTTRFIQEVEAADRLSPEDQAAARDAQFLDMALAEQRLKAEGGAVYTRGVCANCGAPTAAAAIYCDADCRADHERRLAVLTRQGKR